MKAFSKRVHVSWATGAPVATVDAGWDPFRFTAPNGQDYSTKPEDVRRAFAGEAPLAVEKAERKMHRRIARVYAQVVR